MLLKIQKVFSQCINCLQIIGRFIVGFGVSLSAIAECIYISEIAPAVSYVVKVMGLGT